MPTFRVGSLIAVTQLHASENRYKRFGSVRANDPRAPTAVKFKVINVSCAFERCSISPRIAVYSVSIISEREGLSGLRVLTMRLLFNVGSR